MTRKEFEKRTKLPGRTSQSALEGLGARYLTTMNFKLDGGKARIEYMVLEKGGNLYLWRRTAPREEKFTIRGEFQGRKH